MTSPQSIDPDTKLRRYFDFLEQTIPKSADDALTTARDARESRTARDAKVRDEIATTWKLGWDYFDAALFAMEQNALYMIDRANKTEDHHTSVREALLLIWSAATLTTHEIRALLHAGLWPGAAARWRALHELAVAGTLCAKSGNAISGRYLDHSFVVQTKRLLEFGNAGHRIPISKAELDERWRRAQALIAQHRDAADPVAFSAQYGWALPLLPTGKSGRRPRPTFEALEKLANMQDLRMLVGSAHGLVHNDASGITGAIIEADGYILSPVARHIPTVARPTLTSISRLAAATHLGFEPDLNDQAKLLGLVGGALMENARRGAEAFDNKPPTAQADDT